MNKGGNILSDGSGNVKLADFGASKHIENVSLIASVTSSEVCNSVKGYFTSLSLANYWIGACFGWHLS